MTIDVYIFLILNFYTKIQFPAFFCTFIFVKNSISLVSFVLQNFF